MALTYYPITGNGYLPDGLTPEAGQWRIRLAQGYALDGSNWRADEQRFDVATDGSCPALADPGLPATTGTQVYSATFVPASGRYTLGPYTFTLTAAMTFAQIISEPGVVVPTVDLIAEAQAARDEAQTAAGDAAASAAAAEAVGDTNDTIMAGVFNNPAAASWGPLIAAFVLRGPAPTGIDDAANIQAIHDALPATGGIIQLQAGTYKLPTTGLNFTKPVVLAGVGAGTYAAGGTRVECSSPTLNAITFGSEGSGIRDIAVVNTASSTPTAGAGVKATDFDSGRIDRCRIVGFWNCVEIDQGFFYTISETDIFAPVNYGAYLKNPAEQDHGDMTLIGVTFSRFGDTTAARGTAIQWESGGGLRLIGCKANAGAQPGFPSTGFWNNIVVANMQATTSVFVVAGCSFEGFMNSGIIVEGAASVTFGKVAISGTEFLGSGSGGAAVSIDGTGMTGMNSVSITGCVMYGATAGISLKYLKGATVTGNTLNTLSGPWLVLNHVQKFSQAGNLDNGYMLDFDAIDTDNDLAQGFARDPWVYKTDLFGLTTATAIVKMQPGYYAAGVMTTKVYGNLATIGGVRIEQVRPVTYTNTGAATVGAAIGTDVNIGNGATYLTLTYDVASQPGYVIIKLASTNAFKGVVKVTYEGLLRSLNVTI